MYNRKGSKMKKIIIIGFGSSGYAALMAVRKTDPGAVITVIDPKEHDLQHPCGLPYSIEGIVRAEDLVQDVHLERAGASRIRAAAVKIDPSRKCIIAVQNNKTIEVEYDAVIISTGYTPLIPPVKNIRNLLNRGVYTLTDTKDLERITSTLEGCVSGAVIGAGAIGMETACALRRHLERVCVCEMKEQVFPGILDRDISKTVEEYLCTCGIELRLGARVEEITGDAAPFSIKAGDENLEADIIILAAGFQANTGVADESSISCNENGIIVDTSMRTSMENVYAAGDCVSSWSVIDRNPCGVKLATSAYRQGTIAGINAAGGSAEYMGTAGTFVTRISELEVAGTGFNTETATLRGFRPAAGKIKAGILPDYFPGGNEIQFKIISDSATGKIIGAQAAGAGGAAERINLVSMAIEFGIPLDDFRRTELAYCPAVSEVEDPIMKAVDFNLRRIRKK